MTCCRYVVVDMPHGSVLRVEPVKSRRDDSVVECVADNGIGEPAVASANLDVYPEERCTTPVHRTATRLHSSFVCLFYSSVHDKKEKHDFTREASSITPSLFHPRLKTFLFCKSFPP